MFEDAKINPINEHGSYTLNIGDFQIGYYKALPNYFTRHNNAVEGLVDFDLQITLTAIKKLTP